MNLARPAHISGVLIHPGLGGSRKGEEMEAWEKLKQDRLRKFCAGIWTARYIGISGIELARALKVSQPTITNCIAYWKNSDKARIPLTPTTAKSKKLNSMITLKMKANQRQVQLMKRMP